MPNYAFTCQKCGKRITWSGSISQQPPCPACNPKKQAPAGNRVSVKTTNEPNEDAEQAIELCDEILELIDDLPSRASDFGESVGEKVESIRETIDERGHATEWQVSALENMKAGVERWFR